MPAIFANSKVLVLCNDCDAKSESPFHYLGARCQPCGSYNTAVTGRLNFPTQDEIIAFDEQERIRQAENPEAAAETNAELDFDLDSDDDFDEEAQIDIDQEWENQEHDGSSSSNSSQ
jgi:predicted ATP-dependent serine protease